MPLEKRIYSVLFVSASPKMNQAVPSLFPASRYGPVRIETSVSAAKRAFAEYTFDYVILNAPLPDDMGTRFAIDLCNSGETVVLLLARGEIHAEIYEKVSAYGVFTLPKPLSKPAFYTALRWMASARERLRRARKKTLSMEEKMEEIRLVNRAKWILIRELHMEEPEAHRYVEKQAMDRCVTRREVAEEIIRTYT